MPSDKLTNTLRAAREKKKLTQAEIAKELKWPTRSYAAVENGSLIGTVRQARVPRKKHIQKLSKLLGVSYKILVDAAIERYAANKRMGY